MGFARDGRSMNGLHLANAGFQYFDGHESENTTASSE